MSPVILVYMPTPGLGRRSSRILGLAALTSSPGPTCPTGPSSSEADAADVRARLTQGPSSGPSRNEFQVKTRAGDPHPRHVARIVQVPSPCEAPLRLVSLSPLPYLPIYPDSSRPHCFSAICCHSPRGSPDGSLYVARISRKRIHSVVDHR